MSRFQAVIFDLDGTLWETFTIYYRAVRKGLAIYGIRPPSLDHLIQGVKAGESFWGELRDMIRKQGIHVPVQDVIIQIQETFFQLEEERLEPYPGVKELLSRLKERGMKIGLATGRLSSRERIRKICRRMGFDHLVDAVTSRGYVANPKPAPDVIIDCAKRLEVSIETCLIVGDTKDDIVAAHAAGGAAAIGIVSGIDNSEEMLDAGPLAVVETLDGILDFI